MTAFHIKERGPPVHFFLYGRADLLIPFADDLCLGLADTNDQYLIQDNGDHDQAVQDPLPVSKGHLGDKYHEIHHIHGNRHRDPEPLFQYQRRDIHASGGGTCPDHDAQGKSDHNA